jgi:NAD(P)-dependent dehydrogenase (short-subunit alcohol dehydrogenase family)
MNDIHDIHFCLAKMDATSDELVDLNVSQDQINAAIVVLESLSRQDNSVARLNSRSKPLKRIMWSINSIAQRVSDDRCVTRREKLRAKRTRAKEVIARFRTLRASHHYRSKRTCRLGQAEQVDVNTVLPGQAEEGVDSTITIGCYVCKSRIPIADHHDTYRSMCIPCGEFNLMKRNQTGDLSGKVAIVTGARVKIGFQVALKLLRAGCYVIATTRFTVDASARYRMQPDYETWASRLRLVRLELQNRAAIELFCSVIGANFPKIDILINNAAQTISRPREFYRDVIAAEGRRVEMLHRADISDTIICNTIDMTIDALAMSDKTRSLESQVSMVPTSVIARDIARLESFPAGEVDPKNDNQQLDLRTSNSWTQTLETSPVEELLQDLAINCAAPFILIQRLTPNMSHANVSADTSLATDTVIPASAFIINVTAVEGLFYVHHKSSQHPCSNAAKAALNMITRTAGESYWKKYRIAMNAVDTGLVTNEYPAGHYLSYILPPLDEIDGAARILDPIFANVNDPSTVSVGLMLKDYKVSDW